MGCQTQPLALLPGPPARQARPNRQRPDAQFAETADGWRGSSRVSRRCEIAPGALIQNLPACLFRLSTAQSRPIRRRRASGRWNLTVLSGADMNAVPFTLDSVWAGLGQGEGLLRDEGTHLGLEYQLKDGLVGVIKGGVKQVRVPLKDVVSVTLTQGWFGQKWAGVRIVIQAARMDVLQDFPGASQGRIELGISAKDHEAATKLVADLHQDDDAGSR